MQTRKSLWALPAALIARRQVLGGDGELALLERKPLRFHRLPGEISLP